MNGRPDNDERSSPAGSSTGVGQPTTSIDVTARPSTPVVHEPLSIASAYVPPIIQSVPMTSPAYELPSSEICRDIFVSTSAEVASINSGTCVPSTGLAKDRTFAIDMPKARPESSR